MKTNQSCGESCEKKCYKLLSAVLVAGSYSTITLGTALKDVARDERAYITALFYGVLEKSIQFDYIIEKLTTKPPQKSVAVLIKIGLYLLRCTSTPAYAAINKTVNLAKEVGKTGVARFINALLRKSMSVEIPMNSLWVRLSYPEWVIRKLQKRYDDDFIVQMLSRDGDSFFHIRRNGLRVTKAEFEAKLGNRHADVRSKDNCKKDWVAGAVGNCSVIAGEDRDNTSSINLCVVAESAGNESDTGVISRGTFRDGDVDIVSDGSVKKENYTANHSPLGYWVDSSQIEKLRQDEFTVQSLSSMISVRAYLSGNTPKKALDLCSAPGGKAIYLKELSPNTEVVCGDIHPHRVELIKKYAQRMGVSVECFCRDATAFYQDWADAFDLVICDVPCSGFGVKSKPDILLNRKESDLNTLAGIQLSILRNAAKYVQRGGVLCYSTCTIFKEENEGIIEKFLAENCDFRLSKINDKYIVSESGMKNLYPQEYNSDGFFIARLCRMN